ncbi:MAG: FMN-binding negative transcriptional regulator [Propionibacterium sp.]
MYVPGHFAHPAQELGGMLERVRVADLVSVGPSGPEATLLPFTLHPGEGTHGSLHAHLARVNDQWRHEGPVLVIVHGPDSYVDPSDVPAPGAVPTWDYVTMHVHGRLVAHDDPEWVRRCLAELVEAQASEFDFGSLPARMLDGLVRSAVGIEVLIDSVVGKAKMSQNQSSANILGIADALERRVRDPGRDVQGRCPAEVVDFLRERSLAHAREREQAVDEIRGRR